jgi:hypothetical protein
MDMLMMSIAFSVSSAVAGYLLENDFFNLQQGFIIFSIIMVVSGIFFTLWRPDAIKGTSQ